MVLLNTSKVNGNTIDASEWNQFASINNFITNSGLTSSTTNLQQMGIASARYASAGQFFQDTSSVSNNYILSPVAPFRSPVSSTAGEGYFIGMKITFKTANANTSASTVNVNSLGTKSLKKSNGNDLTAGDITADEYVSFIYNGAVFISVNSEKIGFWATNTSDQNIGNATITKINLQTAFFNYGNFFNTSTSKFTPLSAGKYLVGYGAEGVDAVIATQSISAFLFINGSSLKEIRQPYFDNGNAMVSDTIILNMNGTTDYLELYARVSGSGATSIRGGSNNTFLWATKLYN